MLNAKVPCDKLFLILFILMKTILIKISKTTKKAKYNITIKV